MTQTPRTIPSRLSHVKIIKLVDWARANVDILDKLDRVALAKKATADLEFPVAASSFASVAESSGLVIGSKHVQVNKNEQLEIDVKALANVLAMVLKKTGGHSKILEEMIARRGDQP